ncbi:MAG TPA: Asp23/Gls24 family envelope stress response protein [Limnochordales bacterium]
MNSEQWPGGQRPALTPAGEERRQELPQEIPGGFIESQEGELGEVRIANDVVSTIAGLAAVEVEGVAGMAGGIAGGISEILGRRNLSRGVRVEVGEHQAAIDLFIIVHYGVRIPEVAWRVQENVKRQIETMTGLEVAEVNVHIQGVQLPQSERAEESRVR